MQILCNEALKYIFCQKYQESQHIVDQIDCYEEAVQRLNKELDCENILFKQRLFEDSISLLLSPD